MLYIVRGRMKESTTGADIGPINKTLDTELIPALERVQGVNSAEAYNSITGEIVVIIDIENAGTVDRILGDASVGSSVGKWLELATRTGGEILYDRPAWQGLYGNN
ncbi:MAG: hypothetical protein R3A46_06935 [Thermomicrobiales bacterium]